MELGGAAQGLAGADVASALLGVVDDDHGDGVAALQLSQIGEQRRHLTAGVLIDAMQTHEGIEHQQARLQVGDGVVEASSLRRFGVPRLTRPPQLAQHLSGVLHHRHDAAVIEPRRADDAKHPGDPVVAVAQRRGDHRGPRERE